MNFQPLHDRVLISCAASKPQEQQITPGGIFIPETAQNHNPQVKEGVVVAVGPGKYEHGSYTPTHLKPNMRVLYSEYSGTVVKVENQEYLLLRADEVLGCFTNS